MRFDERGRLAFFNQAKSHDCQVLMPEVRHAIEELRDFAEQSASAFAGMSHVEVRAPGLDGRPSAFFVPLLLHHALPLADPKAFLELESQWLVQVYDDAAPAVVQRYPLQRSWWGVPLGSFMQINFGVNELLVEHVVNGAIERGVESFVDLFAGAGNFALPLAAVGCDGHAVELDRRAAEALRSTAAERGLSRLVCSADDAHHWLRRERQLRRHYDLVVLDPPRAGLKASAESSAALARRHILLCSCNTLSLSRDLQALAQLGFFAESVTAFDMFPQTDHIEVAVWLARA